jgi:hypothetical protein
MISLYIYLAFSYISVTTAIFNHGMEFSLIPAVLFAPVTLPFFVGMLLAGH